MDTGLTGRTALVTGGAGGIGGAICRLLAGEGARVAVHYNTKRAEAADLAASLGPQHRAFGADLTREADVVSLFEQVEAAFGRCDVLVANAGYWPKETVPVADLSLERWNATLAVNLTSTFLCCREFLRLVRRQGPDDPSIVMLGSTAGIIGEADHADYAAAKGALHTGLAKSLKNEIVRIAPRGRVNTVCPGWTVTPLTLHRLSNTEAVRRVLTTRPLQRMGRSEDVASAVLYFASPALSGHVTGEFVTVAGGMEGRLLNEPDSVDPSGA